MVSLKFWQNAFKTHTKERTGILKAERLRDALEDVGELVVVSVESFANQAFLNSVIYLSVSLSVYFTLHVHLQHLSCIRL